MIHKGESAFLEQVEQAATWFKSLIIDEVILIHHNDADGLSSGAILASAFYRENRHVRRISLEKPYPDALKLIFESIDRPQRALLVLADFSSGMLPVIEQLLVPGLQVLVLDHHQLSPHTLPEIRVVNPTALGISGRTEATASSVCYLFAKALNQWNSDLALNALVGVIGDGQFKPPLEVEGLNRIPLQDALLNGSLRIATEPLANVRSEYPLVRIVEAVNALGSIGYFEGGTDIAVKGLVDGWGIEVDTVGQHYQDRFRALTSDFLKKVVLNIDGNLCWFALDEEYRKVGVKTVGLLCEELIRAGRIQDGLYLLGIQPVGSIIPGVGELTVLQEKVSMRVTPRLLAAIEQGNAKALTAVLPEVVAELGGFVDACHLHAAAITIPPAKRQDLLLRVRQLVS